MESLDPNIPSPFHLTDDKWNIYYHLPHDNDWSISGYKIIMSEINNLEPLKYFLSNFPKNGCLVFCDINCNKSDFKNILSKKDLDPICILIGPEGDFSEKERKLIIDLNQTHSISLAKNILRAETAAVAAVTLVNYHLNLS
jgi:16S rRNA (uracil1498-N3)-methyltransferase